MVDCKVDDNESMHLMVLMKLQEKAKIAFELGDLETVEEASQELVSLAPRNAVGWYYLGLIANRRGDNGLALALLKKSIEINPSYAEAQNHYGNALRSCGQLEEALECYNLATDLKSDYAAPHYNIGLVQELLGKYREAEIAFRRAIEINPNFVVAMNNLGLLLQNNGKPFEALEIYRNALEIDSNNVDVLNNCGIVLIDIGQASEAAEICSRAVASAPGRAELHNTQGIALKRTGRLEEAIECYKRALEIKPEYSFALNNLGDTLREMNQHTAALEVLSKALSISPEYFVAWHNKGIVYQEMGEIERAISCYRRALAIKPDYSKVYNELGGALAAQGKVEEAVAAYQKAVELDSKSPIAYSNMLFTMHYSPSFSCDEILSKSKKWEQLYGKYPQKRHLNDPDPERMLRVGYVSPDFREHSVAYFLKSIFVEHSVGEGRIYCYSDVLKNDKETDFFKSYADSWRNIVGLNDDSVAKLVLEDKIDILVDLAGHTGKRLPLFSLKPAPIQIAWLGYPGTTGLSAIDYRFSDEIADPENSESSFCSENIYRLHDGFLCYTPSYDIPTIGTPPSLSSNRITFGSFNNISKLTPEVIKLWSQLLLLVPDSRIIIKSHTLADVPTRKRYETLFSENGILPKRVELIPRIQNKTSHLSLYREIDIALDPFPYNGTTTTFEALWMGVPVISLKGDRHAGRVGASILSRVGLEDLIAESKGDYLNIGLSLSRNVDRITFLRQNLRKTLQASPLCDSVDFTNKLEKAYRNCWVKWCSSLIVNK